jgi:hypothetical protein
MTWEQLREVTVFGGAPSPEYCKCVCINRHTRTSQTKSNTAGNSSYASVLRIASLTDTERISGPDYEESYGKAINRSDSSRILGIYKAILKTLALRPVLIAFARRLDRTV